MVRSDGKMSEERVPFSVREEARLGLADWWSARFDWWFFNALCGNTAQSDTKYTGNNAVTAVDSDHIIYPNSLTTVTAVASASASNKFSLDLIDLAVEKAKTLTPAIKPIKIGGKDHFVMFLHPYQVRHMRTVTDTGQWLDIQKAAMQGGKISDNPIFSGALGVYNGVVLHESTYIPKAVSASAAVNNTRLALFCGAQAGIAAFGRDNKPGKMVWTEELFDYKNQLGVSAGCIAGLKKSVFNSKDFATIVIPTWTAS